MTFSLDGQVVAAHHLVLRWSGQAGPVEAAGSGVPGRRFGSRHTRAGRLAGPHGSLGCSQSGDGLRPGISAQPPPEQPSHPAPRTCRTGSPKPSSCRPG